MARYNKSLFLRGQKMAQNFTEFSSKTANPNIPHVYDITAADLLAKKAHVRIIDVRRPDEWVGEFGHIKEAELITLDTLPDHIDDLPKDQTIVFVCRSGARSAQASAFAQQNGLTSVYNLQGGMIAWTQNNFEVVERDGE
jgi:rhodanese-related sulfurtransferase